MSRKEEIQQLKEHLEEIPFSNTIVYGNIKVEVANRLHQALNEKIMCLEMEEYGLCEECGIFPADYPSKLCCGCNDYKDHL